MTADFELLPHKPGWQQAIRSVCDFAAGLTTDASQPRPVVAPVAEEVLRQLQCGEPAIAPHAAAVLMLHDSEPGCLSVVAATPEAGAQSARCKVGALWRDTSPNKLAGEAFVALRSGQPILRSPHGTCPDARSLIPLRGKDGRCFGVLLTGAPAVPDEFAEAMAKAAGPMLERVWKWRKVNEMLHVACMWVRKLSDQLSSVEWREGLRAARGPVGRAWQPLQHHEGEDGTMKTFRLELRWPDSEVNLGVLEVRVADGQELSSGVLELLHTTASLLQDAVREIDAMHVGESIAAMTDYSSAYHAARMLLPLRLHEEMQRQLSCLKVTNVTSELRGYNEVKPNTRSMLVGVLCMLGHDRKQLHTWDDIKPHIRPEMFTEMLAINLDGCRGGQMATRWAESHRATKGANLDALLANGTFPIQVMTKWLLALRLVNQVILAIDTETDPNRGLGTGGEWLRK